MIVRILAIICALLLLANVALSFWPSQVKSDSAYKEKSIINPQYIRLNKEIERKADETNIADNLIAQSQFNQVDQVNQESCFRLGPFMQRSNYELAQAILFNVNVEFDRSERSQKKSQVYRVFLGEYDSKAEVTAMRKKLQDNNVLDHFVRRLPNQRYLISLGIYTTKESADNALDELKVGDLDGIKIQQEEVLLPDSYWLHFNLNENQLELKQLKQLDWGERSAKLGKHECQTS